MFPLRSFLLQLENDGIRLTTRDYERIACVLRCDGNWSIGRLREVLISLLAKDLQQREILKKRFDVFFDQEIERVEHKKKIEIDQLLAELQTVNSISKKSSWFHSVASVSDQISRFRSVPPKSRIKITKQTVSNFDWPLMMILSLIVLRLFFEWHSIPPLSTELMFKINSAHDRLIAKVGEEKSELINLYSSNSETIEIKALTLSGNNKDVFAIKSTDCLGTLVSEKRNCQVKISFQSQVKGIKTADLEVESSIDNHRFKLDAEATEKIVDPDEIGPVTELEKMPIEVIIPQWPTKKQILTIEEQEKWQETARIAAIALLLTVIFAIYLWKYRQPPKDSKPDYNLELPRHFSLEKLGGQVLPRLDDETLSHLADCMGYFHSELGGHHPDINASVQATVDQGGIPSLVFQSRKELRHLIILVDDKTSELGQLNPVAEELRVGMQGLGVSLLFGRFFADPSQFYLEDGQACFLDDFEAERNAYLLLVFSEGLGLRDSQSYYTLEVLSRWPQVAWMIPCLDIYRSPLSVFPARVGIPQYTASASGLIQAFTRFLTECAPQDDAKTETIQLSGVPTQGDAPLGVYLEILLGKALPWAQACAMMQPLTFSLADVLRREYYPYLLAENIEHLVSLPGTIRSITGIRFSNAVLAELRRGFTLRQDDQAQKDILKTILRELDRCWAIELKNNPELQNSLAHLAWQRHYARVELELKPDSALITLSQLALSPLGNAVKADLENIKPDGLSLCKDPSNQDGWQRLGALAKNSGISVLKHYSIKRWQKVLLSLLVMLTLGYTYSSVKQFNELDLSKIVVRVNSEHPSRAGAALQIKTQQEWSTIGKKMALPLQVDLYKNEEYRLAYFYSDSSSPIYTVDLGEVANDIEINMSVKGGQATAPNGLVIVTNEHKKILHNAKIILRNGLFTQSLSAAKRLSLPVGKWEIKVESTKGIGSKWQIVDIKKDKKTIIEFNAHYFRDTLKTGGLGPMMISIPAGKFKMGGLKGGEDETPVHEVQLNAFAIAQYEVTFAEYDAFCDATGRDRPYDQGWGLGRLPVINVSWEDAKAYADWLSEQTGSIYRLPTEAEWEYVARAGTGKTYWWGDDVSHDYTNYGSENCCDGWVEGKDMWFYTAPVGSFSANPFGVYDINGNVREWTNDWYGEYSKNPQVNPGGPKKGSGRVIRGGGWDDSARHGRSASRNGNDPGNRYDGLGFRLARTNPLPSIPFTLDQPEKAEPTTPYSVFTEPLNKGGKTPEMIFLPDGNFKMGDIQGGGDSDERPVHQVTLNAFAIGKFEVTNAQYVEFLNDVKRRGSSEKTWFETQEQNATSRIMGKAGSFQVEPGYENHPINNISWYGAMAYADWLSKQVGAEYRLLTEAEWEYAARAGSKTAYHFGNEENQLAEYAWYADNSENQSHQVDQKKPNKWGLYDMHGNLWEWVQDWYGDYSEELQVNPGGAKKGSSRVVRGGCWSNSARDCRSANRYGGNPGDRNYDLGFRLARTISLPFYPVTLAQDLPQSDPSPVKQQLIPYKSFNDTLKDGSAAPEIVFIPGGSFTMGDIQGVSDEDEKPTHEVSVNDFVTGKYEVTVGEFRRFVEDTNFKTDAEKKGSCFVWNNTWTKKEGASWKKLGIKQSDSHPVACISWQDALAYTEWLSIQTGKVYRLLTEAEWEYAARAGSKTAYHFGNDKKQLAEYAWYDDNSENQNHQVGQKKPNKWGLYDMHGNLWEWAQDWYGDYSEELQVNPGGAKKGSPRVIRGGGWLNSARGSRSANRSRNDPDDRYYDLGFRLARKP